MARELRRRQAWIALLLALAISFAVVWVPFAEVLAWPLLLTSTLFHELGHGLAALALGGKFDSLSLYADGSGMAEYRGAFGRGEIALIAMSGLIGPPLAAMLLLIAAGYQRACHIALGVLGAGLAMAGLFWAGNTLTLVFCLALAFGLLLIAILGAAMVSQITCVFVAVELALASFTRADYLFTDSAQTGAGVLVSDVGQIAEAWWLPFWFWGGLIAVLSIALLAVGAWRFLAALR
ncbi:M50 family metallopeptidase [Pseudomarimonas salicorniae]|uniref:M50 family metallopeptidase n=1 Tax=Pseudomarimonas salicorniae TaxID=2933270 RepID=A0ABT0GF92_9GAMM|nr:M50 family metallopeptidase [Lysobacter sp. CAU 1642]MCK7592695.1 M50 family metallopeptidase [Lysobacter sp. CAU 1642]